MWCRLVKGGEKNEIARPKRRMYVQRPKGTHVPHFSLKGPTGPLRGTTGPDLFSWVERTFPALLYFHAISSSHGTTGPKSNEETNFLLYFRARYATKSTINIFWIFSFTWIDFLGYNYFTTIINRSESKIPRVGEFLQDHTTFSRANFLPLLIFVLPFSFIFISSHSFYFLFLLQFSAFIFRTTISTPEIVVQFYPV